MRTHICGIDKYKLKRDLYKKKAIDKIESIFESLNIEYYITNERIHFACPIHQAGKLTTSVIYLNNGFWQCFSHGCHNNYDDKYHDVISLIQGALGDDATTGDVYEYIDKPHNINKKDFKVELDLQTFLDESLHPAVKIPSQYYLQRNISREALIEFKVGDCHTGDWADRAIIPIYHDNGKYVGYTGRSMLPACPKCDFHHDNYTACPNKFTKNKADFVRWRHCKGTKLSKTFYGINKINSEKVILVEGISCVWRLWENDLPAIGALGTAFGLSRKYLLQSMGIKSIILAGDNDVAGAKFNDHIKEKYSDDFKLYPVKLPTKDVTDMTNEQIQSTIGKIWKRI